MNQNLSDYYRFLGPTNKGVLNNYNDDDRLDFTDTDYVPVRCQIKSKSSAYIENSSFTSQFNEIDHILLAGGNAIITGLAKLLQQKLSYWDTFSNPILKNGFSRQIEFKNDRNDSVLTKDAKDVDAKWWGIGVRLEDDILITATGNRNMSEKPPRKPEAGETIVRKALKAKK